MKYKQQSKQQHFYYRSVVGVRENENLAMETYLYALLMTVLCSFSSFICYIRVPSVFRYSLWSLWIERGFQYKPIHALTELHWTTLERDISGWFVMWMGEIVRSNYCHVLLVPFEIDANLIIEQLAQKGDELNHKCPKLHNIDPQKILDVKFVELCRHDKNFSWLALH